MGNKIQNLLEDIVSILEKHNDRAVEIKKIIDGCKTSKQVENCRKLILTENEKMDFYVKKILKTYKIINKLSFNNIEKFLKKKIEKKIKNLFFYFNEKFEDISTYEYYFKKITEKTNE